MIGDRWGVSDAEVAASYPCDTFVDRPALRAWRGVDVAAPPQWVWPWVAQLRVAPYSYDWVDNGGRRSPRRLLDLPEPQVGDPFTATRGRPIGRLLAVEPGRSLTGEVLGAVMTYVVAPVTSAGSGDPGRSRLLLKVVMETSRPVAALVTLGDLVMARKQLLTWRDLAEGR